MQKLPRSAAGLLAAGALVALLCAPGLGAAGTPPSDPPQDPLAALGIAPTGGAAAGYVPDRVCAMCHRDQDLSYRRVGMARSFARPRPENDIEDFAHSSFVHAKSGRHYEMLRRGERLVFRRFELDSEGKPIDLFERDVDWVLGSGNHARVYLYRTPGGELYQLPVAWYTQEGRWGMAPGYDRPDHQGVLRRVRRECMFCHNAYPDVPAGSDEDRSLQTYPADLPEGTGCQRCHGPGAEHARLALGMVAPPDRVRAAIVNPGRLPPERRDDVCYECHLQPAVALAGVRRFGRGDYSFRPGEQLTGFRVDFDVVEEGVPRAERFEINHHPYRLRQSRCWVASQGRLSCLTCHDPHVKVPPAERAAHYRAACLTCHHPEDCKLPSMPAGTRLPAADPGDCVTCHMPKRRTQDVVHVVMTDHLIRRRPPSDDLTAPLAESEPVLLDASLYRPEEGPRGAAAEIYRAVAVLRAGKSPAALEHLARQLAAQPGEELEPWLDLAQGELGVRRFAAAEATLRKILARRPDDALAREWLGVALAGAGRPAEALAEVRKAVAANPDRPEGHFNLGRLLLGRGRAAEAAEELRRALALRPVFVAAWFELGRAEQSLGHGEESIGDYRRALEVDPSYTAAYVSLGRALLAAGRRPEALRYLRHGRRAAARGDEVGRVLAEVEKGK